MLIVKNNFLDIKKGGVFALGNFDGVHLGHKEIINNAKKISSQNSSKSGVVVFEPHPRKFFNKETNNFYLSDIRTKEYLVKKFRAEK